MDQLSTDEQLWQSYRDRLMAFVRSKNVDEDVAEDIVHESLVRAFRSRHTLRDARRLDSWLYTITRNVMIDQFRSRRNMVPLPGNLSDSEIQDSADAEREMANCMEPLIQSLPPIYRDAMVLSELQGLSQAETARRLGLSVSGAKSRVQRGRILLKKQVLQCCKVEFDVRGKVLDFEARDREPKTINRNSM